MPHSIEINYVVPIYVCNDRLVTVTKALYGPVQELASADNTDEMYIARGIIHKSRSRAESNRIGSIRGRRTRPKRSSAGLIVGVGVRVWAITLEIGIICNAYTMSTFWLLLRQMPHLRKGRFAQCYTDRYSSWGSWLIRKG